PLSTLFPYTTLFRSNTWTNEYQGRATYDFNTATGNYSNYNNLLSFQNSLKGVKTAPSVGYQINGEKYFFSINSGTTINNYDVSSDRKSTRLNSSHVK